MSKHQRYEDMSDEQFQAHKRELERGSEEIYDKVERAKERVRTVFRKRS